MKKLDEICEIEYGTRVVQKRDGGKIYPVYGGGGATFAMDIYNRENRLVISRFGMSAQCTRFVDGRFFLNDSGLTIRPKKSNILSQDFLNKWVFSANDVIYALGKGTAQKNLDVETFRCLILPVPPLSEQQRIVAILDEAFECIATAKANTEKNLKNARTLFDSYLNSVFSQLGGGWAEKPLAELCDIKHGFPFKSEFFVSEGDYVVLTPGNFYESGGYRDRFEKQKFYSGDIPGGYIVDKGDLLVAMTEQAAGLLGSPILVPESNRFLHNQRLGLVTKKAGVPWCNEFFFHLFNTKRVRHEIHASASGVKVRHTSPTKIGQVVVSFPSSVAEQQRIVVKLDKLSEETRCIESIYRKKIMALDALKKSILHKAFSGKL